MRKKWITAGATAILLMSTSAGVYAGSNLQQIKAFLNPDIKFQLNGKPFQPQNDKGAVMAPISYNGSTYLPVRAISNALGVAIDYDNKSNTIFLGEKAVGVPISEGFDADFRTKDPQLTSYNGKDYKDVFFNNADGNRSSGFILYPKGKYQKLYLQVAAVGKDIEKFFVQDTKTDAKLEIDTIDVAEGIKTFEIDISGVETLFIHSDLKDDGSIFIPLTTSYYK